MNLFDFIYERIWFPKEHKIRFFEAFSGIGCQAMALKRITDNFEIVGISEIDKYALQSYMAIHGEVNNYGDISLIGTLPQCDIFTWSFPCTDLSKAGKQKGLTNTRSGLVYQVLRLLRDTAEYCPYHRHEPKRSKIHSMGKSTDYYQPMPNKSKLPKVLIMENVVDLVQSKFVDAFNEIQKELEQLGYTNYNEVLNAKDYGVAQNRQRIFMVSILKNENDENYNYVFPEPKPLTKRLKDYLEDNVDSKYYLSDKALLGVINTNFQQTKLESRTEDENGVMPTLCARDYKDPKLVIESIMIPEATEQGYAVAHDGDGIYINRPHQKRGCVQQGMIQTIKTMPNDVGVVVKTWNEDDMPRHRIYTDDSVGFTITTNESQMLSIVKIGNYSPSGHNASSIVDKNGIAPTVMENHGTQTAIVEEQPSILQKARGNNKGGLHEISPTITSNAFQENNHLVNGLKIRKLTPRECWRLMGISDDDFDKAQASGMSNAQLYKQAGNGIVVDVFEAILSQMIERNK